MCRTVECGCGHPAHHAHMGCCAPSGAPWRLPTREEAIRQLEEYLSYLQAEVKGVEARLAELKKGG